MPITKHDKPSLADHAAFTPPPIIDEIARDLQAKCVRTANSFYPDDETVDPSLYSLAITRCIYELFKDHRGTTNAKAWIKS